MAECQNHYGAHRQAGGLEQFYKTQSNLQCQEADQLLPGDWEGRVREEWVTRGHKETFGDKGYVHYLHGGDSITNAYMSKFTTVCFKCLLSKIHQLILIKLVKKFFFFTEE